VKGLIALLAFTCSTQAVAQEVRLITCPIYRDTDAGKKSGCWLADDIQTGQRYDITPSPSKPDWNRAVLVEGRVATKQEDVCGGLILEPAHVSVLDQTCTRHMLEAEGFKGRLFVLPKRNVDPLSDARTPPLPPYNTRSFALFFNHESSFLTYQYTDYLLDQMVTWLRAAKPTKIVITGYAATHPSVISGQRIAETPGIAVERANTVAESLLRLGFPRSMISVKTKSKSQPLPQGDADGLIAPSSRRVEIRAEIQN
jgi:outer membrane protein OmpA-like peptidoglycan-associated protein